MENKYVLITTENSMSIAERNGISNSFKVITLLPDTVSHADAMKAVNLLNATDEK